MNGLDYVSEFFYIKTGDTVLISGIYDININNKYGKIKDIFVGFFNKNSSYIAIVEIDNIEYNVNFEYIYKINRFSQSDINILIKYDQPLEYFIKKFKIKNSDFLIDEYGQKICLSTDFNNKQHIFLFSSLN